MPSSVLVLAGMVAAGALAVAIGLFLPAAEIAAPIPIADNSLIQHSQALGIGFFLILAVLLTADVMNRRKAKLSLLIPMMFCGIMIAVIAYNFSKNLPFEPTNRFAARVLEQSALTSGVGVWAVGLGGCLIAVAALVAIFTREESA